MIMRHVPDAVCPQCAGDVVERYMADGAADARPMAERVLGRSCVNSLCRWRQFSHVNWLSRVGQA